MIASLAFDFSNETSAVLLRHSVLAILVVLTLLLPNTYDIYTPTNM